MKSIMSKLGGVCILAATFSLASAHADQIAVCDSLKHLAKKEYREKLAAANRNLRTPMIQTIIRTGNLFAVRLTPEHLNYIAAAKAGQLDGSRLSAALNNEVSEPALEDLRAVGSLDAGSYPFSLSAYERRLDSKTSVLLQVCATRYACISFDLYVETDYRKAVEREARKLAQFPEKSEEQYLRDSLPSICHDTGDDLIDPRKVEAESTPKTAPSPETTLPPGCFGYGSATAR